MASVRTVVFRIAIPALLISPGPTASCGETPWPIGGWRVIDRALGLDSRLARLEVRSDPGSGRIDLVASRVDDRGEVVPWGTARVGRSAADLPLNPEAEWIDGGSIVRLSLRFSPDGRPTAILRERDRANPSASPTRVRQVTLARAEAEDRLVAEAAARPKRPPSFSGSTRGEQAALYVAGSDGSNLRMIAGPDGFARAAQPAWSPDGRRIAFTGFDSSGRDPLVFVVDARGGPTVAVASGLAPTWSRDGSRLAYMAGGKPEFATDWNAPGRNDERIEAVRLAGPGAGDVEVLARGLWPRFSPTDDRLAFVARLGSNWDLYLRSADGASLSRLTDDPATDTYPRWSTDGLSLVFLSDRGNRWDLYRVSADARGLPRRLTDHRRREDSADVSPSGEFLAFHDASARPDGRILILDLASGAVRPLLDPPQGDRDPSWSPDGRSIAFVSRRPSPLLPIVGPRP